MGSLITDICDSRGSRKHSQRSEHLIRGRGGRECEDIFVSAIGVILREFCKVRGIVQQTFSIRLEMERHPQVKRQAPVAVYIHKLGRRMGMGDYPADRGRLPRWLHLNPADG